MPTHGEHLLICAIVYGVLVYVISSWCSRLAGSEAIQALQQGRRSNPSRGSSIFAWVVTISLPLFIVSLSFVR